MQLPFVAHLLPGVPIVPMVMGCQRRETAFALGDALARAVGRDRRPRWSPAATCRIITMRAAAEAMDAVVLGHVERLDAEGLMQALEREPHHACGGGPMVAVMHAARQLGCDARAGVEVRGLRRRQRRQVVGRRLHGGGDLVTAGNRIVGIRMINEDDQKQLLALARQALEARVTGGRAPDVVCTGRFALRCGAFVSIHSGEHLRGCLGRLTVDSPLGRTLAHLGARGGGFRSAVSGRLAARAAVPADRNLAADALSVRSRRSTRSRVGRHGLIVEQAAPGVCCCRRWQSSTRGIARRFSSTRVSKQDCRATPGGRRPHPGVRGVSLSERTRRDVGLSAADG